MLRRKLIAVARETILGLRQGMLRQDTVRLIQRDLDLEEARLPRLSPRWAARSRCAELLPVIRTGLGRPRRAG